MPFWQTGIKAPYTTLKTSIYLLVKSGLSDIRQKPTNGKVVNMTKTNVKIIIPTF